MGPALLVAGVIAGGVLLVRSRSSSSSPTAKPEVPRYAVARNVVFGKVARGRPEGMVAATTPPGVPAGPPPPEKKPAGLGIKLPGELGTIMGAIPAASKVLDVVGATVQNVTGSEAAGNLARIAPIPAALGFGGQKLGSELTKFLGGNQDAQKSVGQFTGLVAVGGPLALGVPIGAGVSAAVGAIGGQQAEKDFRAAVAQLDPTSSTSAVGSTINNVVNAGFGLVKGIFG